MRGIRDELLRLIDANKFKTVLEAGCGTGHWLKGIRDISTEIYGIDLSEGMLREAQKFGERFGLICADADRLPFIKKQFDLIYCVNAIHQFTDKKEFIISASKLLRPNGILAVFGLDPRNKEDEWYVYKYFDHVLENDLARFPSFGKVEKWMIESGLQNIERKIVEKIRNDRKGGDIFNDSFLQKEQSSQLAALSNHYYSDGIERIKREAVLNPDKIFPVRMNFTAISGRRT
ncbi:MAG: class I SAM-dependent methyltransferase [Melioribacteraceae bacterium]